MAQKTPNDEYDLYGGPASGDDPSVGEEEEYDEQSVGFDETYMTPDAPRHAAGEPEEEPEAPLPVPRERKRGRLARRGGRRKDRLAKKQAARGQDLPAVRESPLVGRDLRPGQMLVYDSELDEVDYTDPDDVPEVRDYLPVRFRRYGRSGLGGGILYALFVISVSIILACFAWMCAVDVLALNKELVSAAVTIAPYEPTGDMPVTVELKNADGTVEQVPIQVDIDQAADALKSAGIIEYKWLFKLFASFSHANIKMDPGTYDLDTSLDYRALVTKMQFGSGAQEITKVTFPEGFSLDQIFTLLEQEYICKKDELYDACANYEFDFDFLADLPYGDDHRLEGYLFPDTYEFYQGEGGSNAIRRFLRNFDARFTEDMRAKAEKRGLTMREVLIMASLIEKEAGSTEGERETMASVIYNRLDAGMPLGLDSTINYIKGTSTFDLTQEDLAIDDPYNTYLYTGLPPGPICNPGLASIEAVLNPASTNYYYWYSVDGVSSFFTTYEEQQAFAHDHPV